MQASTAWPEDTQPLQPELDCPANAQYFDAILADDNGEPLFVSNAVCLFERTPHLLWEHFDIFSTTAEAQAGRELVMRYATAVGNYDYFFDWVFKQDGGLQLRVGAGGILEFKGVKSVDLPDARDTEDARFGTLVAANLAATFRGALAGGDSHRGQSAPQRRGGQDALVRARSASAPPPQ